MRPPSTPPPPAPGRWLKGQIRMGATGGPRLGHELAGKRLGLLGFGRAAKVVKKQPEPEPEPEPEP